jgi:hypothetical protein
MVIRPPSCRRLSPVRLIWDWVFSLSIYPASDRYRCFAFH